jgi:hypothetical protein
MYLQVLLFCIYHVLIHDIYRKVRWMIKSMREKQILFPQYNILFPQLVILFPQHTILFPKHIMLFRQYIIINSN